MGEIVMVPANGQANTGRAKRKRTTTACRRWAMSRAGWLGDWLDAHGPGLRNLVPGRAPCAAHRGNRRRDEADAAQPRIPPQRITSSTP